MSDLVTNPALLPPGAAGGPIPVQPGTSGAARTARTEPASSFASVLAETTPGSDAPTFSKHALERLSRRGIEVDDDTLGRLTDGIQRAADKHARNSVVFVDGTAYVTSVQNNTVITAVSPEHMRTHVFTNIDSAVIA